MPKGKREIVNADDARRFHIHEGVSVGNLLELKEAFESMSDEQYHFHVALEKNDFAAWVRDILQDEPASKLLFGCLKKKTALSRIITVLRRYKLDGYHMTLPPIVKKEQKPKVPQGTYSPISSTPETQPPSSVPPLPPLPQTEEPPNPHERTT